MYSNFTIALTFENFCQTISSLCLANASDGLSLSLSAVFRGVSARGWRRWWEEEVTGICGHGIASLGAWVSVCLCVNLRRDVSVT